MSLAKPGRVLRALAPHRIWASAQGAFYASPAYAALLKGPVPADVRGTPAELWTGDAAAGHALVAGLLLYRGARTPLGDAPFASGSAAAGPIGAALHGFGWLRDLRAANTEDAHHAARRLTEQWLAAQPRWSRDAWRADVSGERIANWLTHYVFLGADQDPAFRHTFLQSLAGQLRHVSRTLGTLAPDHRRFLALRGQIYGGLSLGNRRILDAGLRTLEAEIAAQVLPDGGARERSPEAAALILRVLLEVRAALIAAHIETPQAVQGAIDRLAPFVKALRHGDGALALFNGATELSEAWLGMLLSQSGSRGKALTSAPHSAFYRLSAGRTAMIIDCGAPPPAGSDIRAHTGLLAFELSIGRDRLVVNCGSFADTDANWFDALRATAAHSTLGVADLNAADVLPGGGIGARPRQIEAARREIDGNLLIEASHDGYLRSAGMYHRRSIYLAPDGGDIRGEDVLDGPAGRTFTVRFHLHPRVQASLAQDGATVLLRLAGGSGWRVRAAGGRLSLEDSIYCGDGFNLRRSRQIVIDGTTAEETTAIRWSFRREG